MSVPAARVRTEAQKFSLVDYVGNRSDAVCMSAGDEWKTRPLTFCVSSATRTTATPQLKFTLPDLRPPEPKETTFVGSLAFPHQHNSTIPARNGVAHHSEIMRVTGLLEEAKIKHAKLTHKLVMTENSVVLANNSIKTERAAYEAKVAQLVGDAKAARNTETRLRSDLAKAPSVAAAKAEAAHFKLLAVEAEQQATKENMLALKAELQAREEELAECSATLSERNAEHERVCAEMSKLQTVGEQHEESVLALKATLQTRAEELHKSDAMLSGLTVEHQRVCSELVNMQEAWEQERRDNPALEETVSRIAAIHESEMKEAADKMEAESNERACLKKRVCALTEANAESSGLLAKEIEDKQKALLALESAVLDREHAVAQVKLDAAADVAASNQRFDAMKATLPETAQERLDKYSELLARAKLLTARAGESQDAAVVAAVAQRKVRNEFQAISEGTKASGSMCTRSRHTARAATQPAAISVPRTRRVLTPATTGIHSAFRDALSTSTAQATDMPTIDAEQIAAMPRQRVEDRVKRAVSTVKADLISALNARKNAYVHAAARDAE